MIDFNKKDVTPESVYKDSQILYSNLMNIRMSMVGLPGLEGCPGAGCGRCPQDIGTEEDHRDIHNIRSAIYSLQQLLRFKCNI